jgi:hypothetical protein
LPDALCFGGLCQHLTSAARETVTMALGDMYIPVRRLPSTTRA